MKPVETRAERKARIANQNTMKYMTRNIVYLGLALTVIIVLSVISNWMRDL